MGQSRKLIGQSRKMCPGCAGRAGWSSWDRDRAGSGPDVAPGTGRRVSVRESRFLWAYSRHRENGPSNFARG